MTESDWLTSTNPKAMLNFLQDSGRGSVRKLRLFACACSRLVWDRLPPGDMRDAVETAERLADGLARERDRVGYVHSLYRMTVDADRDTGANWFSSRPREDVSAYFAALLTLSEFGRPVTTSLNWEQASLTTGQQQPDLLRDVFGNPFRPLPIDPAWLAWNEGIVKRLAEVAYQERAMPAGHLDPARLAVLADALTDAGCTDTDLIDHLRSPGPHVRGCWPVDLLSCRD
jgi:hypothetical protein